MAPEVSRMPIRTLVTASDLSSRQILHAAIIADAEVSLVAECSTSKQAIAATIEHRPSLMFLDIQMPDLNCLELIKVLGAETLVATLFVVPPGNYAMKAFDGHALGYLVKPITGERLLTALREAKAYIQSRCLLERDPNRVLNRLGVKSAFSNQDRILIKDGGRFIFVKTEEIDWIQANGNYVRVHVGHVSYLHRQTITGLERSLDPTRFLRIHRSAIVNIDKVRELRPWPTGEYVVLMRTGKELTLSRTYRGRLPFLAGGASPVDNANEDPVFSPIDQFPSQLKVAHETVLSSPVRPHV
jgi:two-component system, LytTR family, response regulator